jgi:hypothetical protein
MIKTQQTLRCQLTAIADFVCQSPLDLAELRALANDLRHATKGIETEAARRAGHPDLTGVFG